MCVVSWFCACAKVDEWEVLRSSVVGGKGAPVEFGGSGALVAATIHNVVCDRLAAYLKELNKALTGC